MLLSGKAGRSQIKIYRETTPGKQQREIKTANSSRKETSYSKTWDTRTPALLSWPNDNDY
jgi:hypothetical protein